MSAVSFSELVNLIRKSSTDAEDLNELEILINQIKTANRINNRIITFEYKINKTGDVGTLLHLAISFGNVNAVHFLLKVGADISLKTKKNLNVLHIGALEGNTDIVMALLMAGANVNAKDPVRFPSS